MTQLNETETSSDGLMKTSNVRSINDQEQEQLPAPLWSEADFLATIPARFQADRDVLEMAARFRR